MDQPRDEIYRDWVTSIYTNHCLILRKYCVSKLQNTDRDMLPLVDDFLQETFFLLYKKRRLLYNHENVIGWLVLVLKNKIRNAQMKKRRHNERTMVPEEIEYCLEQGDDVEEIVLDQTEETFELVRRIINNEEKSQAFIDYYVNNVPLDDVAKQYGKSRDAMKVQLFRTRKLCQAVLKDKNVICLLIIIKCVTFFDFMT